MLRRDFSFDHGLRSEKHFQSCSSFLFFFLSRFGPRFFTLNEPYDVEWRAQALQVSNQLGIRSKVKEGVYTMLGGPNFETPAELRMLHMCGVDAVGKLRHPILATLFENYSKSRNLNF